MGLYPSFSNHHLVLAARESSPTKAAALVGLDRDVAATFEVAQQNGRAIHGSPASSTTVPCITANSIRA